MNSNGPGKDKHTYDAIVIGSGISEGWAAKELCETGFGLFKNKRITADNETSLDCQPITLSGRYATVLATREEELKTCVAINRTDRMPDKIAGSRQNRLLQ